MSTTVSNFEGSNFLQPTGFKVVVNRKRFKNLEFFAQAVVHPDISATNVVTQFRGTNLNTPGDKLEYGQLSIDAILDENLNVYKEMHTWLQKTVTEPFTSSASKSISNQDTTEYDISLLVLSSHNNKTDTIRYKNCFPTNLGSINFQSSVDGLNFLTFSITFAYTSFTISD